MELAIVNQSSDPVVADTLAWAARAINLQLSEHFLPAYDNFLRRLRQPFEHRPIAGYASLKGIDPSTYDPCYVLDKVPAGELGSHQNTLGFVSGRALAQGHDTSVTLSHEAIEWRADRACSLWIKQVLTGNPLADAVAEALVPRALAFEPCDAVESTFYEVEVEMLGINKAVRVSNFVLPNWFIPGSEGPWDWMGLLNGPGKLLPNCHAVSMMDGNIVTAYGRGTIPQQHAERMTQPLSRTHKRVGGVGSVVVLTPH